VDVMRRAWALTPSIGWSSVLDEVAADEEADPLSLIELGAWTAARHGATDGKVR
jgi:hypothetical protein